MTQEPQRKGPVGLMLDEIALFTPKDGFNLVGIDDFGTPGDSLYLIGHFDTLAEAKRVQKRYGEDNTNIYPLQKKSGTRSRAKHIPLKS